MGGATKLLLLLSSPFPRPSALLLARRPTAPFIALSSTPSLRARPFFLLSSGSRLRVGFSSGAAEQAHTQAVSARESYGEAASSASSSPAAAHPWPEWLRIVEHVAAGGYADRRSAPAATEQHDDDSFIAVEDLTDGFVRAAEACLLFARDRPDLIRLLSKKDMEIVVENGYPFLFKNGANSTRRMKSFLGGDGTNVFESEKVGTVDIMRYLLSNSCNFAIHDDTKIGDIELIQASTRTLLAEIVDAAGQSSSLIGNIPRHTTAGPQMSSRVPAQNIEMKRGDWICLKCSFMNFARNMRCLECNEARPKRVLTGGEWECPQCDFFNYGRNMSCLRCDCRRTRGENSLKAAASNGSLGHNGSSTFEHIVKGSNVERSEIERKLAANDEKAERWFSKMSQLGDAADLSSAIDDEDFPEIMPMRKGVNRFVVSTRKTPLERRLAAQNNSTTGEPGSIKTADLGSGGSSESSISQSLDRILGCTSPSSGTKSQVASGEGNSEAGSKFSSSEYNQKMANQRIDSNYVPFVPLPPDMFKPQNANNDQSQKTDDFSSTKAGQKSEFVHNSSMGSIESKNIDSSDSAERWSKNVAEPNIVKDVANSASEDDFPDIMPMRKGENRFVISKKKDRTLTSPQYKRRMAMDQANSSNFVPFVPFPPDYFAKKDKKTPEASENIDSASVGMPSNEKPQTVPEKFEEIKTNDSNMEFREATSRYSGNQSISHFSEPPSANNSVEVMNECKAKSVYNRATSTSVRPPGNSWSNQNETFNSGYSQKSPGASPPYSQQSSPKGGGEDWKPSFSGKSLEGSAVSEEPDPLDMSEEAKAARWFRRVAQIKDISELSNIPDEDFPEIMPMRKGVNRFVVSKRKTPLERRLTSAQYRRNLPIISSEPGKDTNE